MSEQLTSELKMHHGRTLLRCAGYYPTLAEIMFEGVQNAIDQEATRIDIRLDLRERTLIISDNGTGASIKKFERALASIGNSIKGPRKLGQFGYGLIAPLGKCESFTFTATEAGKEDLGYNRWTFAKDLAEQETIRQIPFELAQEFEYSAEDPLPQRRGKNVVWWRAQMRVKGIIRNRALTRFDPEEFCNLVVAKFRQPMFRNSILLSLRYTDETGNTFKDADVRATNYEGKQLPEFRHETEAAGATTFVLYLALNTRAGRKGKVYFGASDDDFRVEADDFLTVVRHVLVPEVAKALTSGYFEGDIVADNITLQPDRKSFLVDDALVAMCESIEAWYEKVGKAKIEELAQRDDVTRWQTLGKMALDNIQEILNRNKEYQGILDKIKIGTEGEDESKSRAAIGDKEDGLISTRKKNPDKKEEGGGGGGGGGGGDKPPRPKPGSDGLGDPKKVVKGGSTGLQFEFVELGATPDVYNFDIKTGLLQFNTVHPFWTKCHKTDTGLVRYIEAVTHCALILAQYEGDSGYNTARRGLKDFLSFQVDSISQATTSPVRFKERKKK